MVIGLNLNVLAPSSAVKSALEKPNIGTAIVLVLLPTIVSIIATIVYGFNILPGEIILSVLKNFGMLLAMSAILYILAHLVKGATVVKGKFQSIVSAISLIYVVILIMTIIGFVAMPMIFSQPILKLVKQVQSNEITSTQAVERLSILSEKPNSWNPMILMITVLVSAILCILALFLLYKVVAELFAMKGLRNLALFFVWLILIGMLSLILFKGTLFQGF